MNTVRIPEQFIDINAADTYADLMAEVGARMVVELYNDDGLQMAVPD